MWQGQRHGHWNRGERVFHKGDFKYLILDLLNEKPRHGYEIIRDLEERCHGFYSPSPGVVYPTLQWLEEIGYVTSAAQDGKKIYTITEEGKAFLAQKGKETEAIKGQMENRWGCWGSELHEEMHEAMHTLGDLGRMVGRHTRRVSAEKMKQIHEILRRSFSEIEKIFKE